jgi:threonine synthase
MGRGSWRRPLARELGTEAVPVSAPATYRSTRATMGEAVGFSAALRHGLALDGGLYVPTAWPSFEPRDLLQFVAAPANRASGTRPGDGADLAGLAARLIAPFAAGDSLAPALPAICREAFDFPAPRIDLTPDGRYGVLELFHGPTAAFKDFGARFLAACFERLRGPGARTVNVLVATSGDTGGAVAAAFHRRPGLAVTVLFPKGLVSPTQERQLTCWGDNVTSLAVRGTFDDCQRLVKAAFVDPSLRGAQELSSANSINLGRLLPQMVYYAATSLEVWQRTGAAAAFVIPSGNLGNAAACVWARRVGLPIGRIVLAHNANRTVPDYLSSGDWQPRASVATLASAMDVGHPSNMERLQSLHVDVDAMRGALSACSVDDAAIQARIRNDFASLQQVWCPHTAVGAEAWARLSVGERAAAPWTLVATAHPAKFPEIVEPLIGRRVDVPAPLAALFARPTHCLEIDATLPALSAALAAGGAPAAARRA